MEKSFVFRIVGVHVIAVEIRVHGEIVERLPRWLILGHFDALPAVRRNRSDWWMSCHFYTGRMFVSNFETFLFALEINLRPRKPSIHVLLKIIPHSKDNRILTRSCCISNLIWFFLSLHRLFWNQTRMTRGDKPDISTICSFISASGRGFAL